MRNGIGIRITLTLAVSMVGMGCSSAGPSEGGGAVEEKTMTAEEALEAGYVRTPFGLVHSSCVHALQDGATVNESGVVDSVSGLAASVAPCGFARIEASALRSGGSGPATPATNGWVSAAWWDNPVGFSYISANFVVPREPASRGSQTIFFFPSFEPTQRSAIVQPVLQWGPSAAGGGASWGIASWILFGSSVFHSSLLPARAGDSILGTVQGAAPCTGGRCQSWTVTTRNARTGQTATLTNGAGGLPYTAAQGGVLEVYGVSNCSQYPADGTIRFTSVVVKDSASQQVAPRWQHRLFSASPNCNFSVTEPDATTVALTY